MFLDEVTALEGWELFVKRYYDLRFPFRFVCTSSAAAFAAAFLKKRSRESLAGRISAIQVYPFCLSEVMGLRGMEESMVKAHSRLRDLWAAFYRDLDVARLHADLREAEREFGPVLLDDLPVRLYLLEGGFPEYILAGSERYKHRYFLESVVERTLFHDIGPVFGTTDLHLLHAQVLTGRSRHREPGHAQAPRRADARRAAAAVSRVVALASLRLAPSRAGFPICHDLSLGQGLIVDVAPYV